MRGIHSLLLPPGHPAGREAPRRIAIISTASGSGKTTLGRALARRLELPFVELDALHHGPGWSEPDAEAFRTTVAPLVARPAWVIDGGYMGKLGDLVVGSADLVVWLDLPARVWLPRLLRRTVRRVVRREELWNGNRESLRGAVWGRDSLIRYSVRQVPRRRRSYPERLGAYPLVRVRSGRELDELLAWAREAEPG